MKPVPISKAKALANEFGVDGVAIFIFSDGQVGATSYGADKAKCKDMGRWIDGVVDGMGEGKIKQPFHGDCPWPRITQDD